MKYNFRLFWRTFYRSFFNSKNTPARLTRKRFLFLALFYIVWPGAMLMHWFFFWLDDILFPDYKNHPIEKPLFILGNLRSGSSCFRQRRSGWGSRRSRRRGTCSSSPRLYARSEEGHAMFTATKRNEFSRVRS